MRSRWHRWAASSRASSISLPQRRSTRTTPSISARVKRRCSFMQASSAGLLPAHSSYRFFRPCGADHGQRKWRRQMSFGKREGAGRRRRFVRYVCAVALACASACVQAQAPWPANLYNPQATAGDIVLPMPCGGSMTLRPVYVPGANALDDRRIQIGNPDAKFAYAENTRTDYVGGGFTDTKQKSQRYFLIGKYEITTLQFDALSGTCPAVNENGRLPKTAVTWNEAVTFTARYSDWLAKNAAGK